MPKTQAKSRWYLLPPPHQCNQSWAVLSLPVLSIPPPTQYPRLAPTRSRRPIPAWRGAHRDSASGRLCCQCLSQPVAGWQSLLGGFWARPAQCRLGTLCRHLHPSLALLPGDPVSRPIMTKPPGCHLPATESHRGHWGSHWWDPTRVPASALPAPLDGMGQHG